MRSVISKPWNLLARRVHREGCNAKGKHARAIIFFSRRVECGWIEGDENSPEIGLKRDVNVDGSGDYRRENYRRMRISIRL